MAFVGLDATKWKLRNLCYLQEYREKNTHQKIANDNYDYEK
jgi:hypothetical protein